jgi:cysteinyl-tRNA synthetase
MSMKYLGKTLDIHGGGLDLQFPHHENELAQSESYTDQPFARFWMHNGLLKMGNVKMAGSVGNVVNIVDLLKIHHPDTIRFLLLSTHYRSPIDFETRKDRDPLNEMKKSLEGFYRFFERYERITKRSFYALKAPANAAEHAAFRKEWGEENLEGEEHLSQFLSFMEDDFNTGGAVSPLYELLKQLNRLADQYQLEGEIETKYRAHFERGAIVLKEMGQVLGLFHEPPPKAGGDQLATGLLQLLADLKAEPGSDRTADGLMQVLIAQRAQARKAKNFAVADQIRKRLGELGVTIEDRPGGTGWRVG